MRLGRVRFEAKYLAIQHFHAEKGWSIRWMCRQLGISKAAYYKWLHRSVPQAEQENLVLAELIREYDEQYNHILGYRWKYVAIPEVAMTISMRPHWQLDSFGEVLIVCADNHK